MKQNQYKNTFFSCITACIAALAFMTSCDTEYNTTYVSGDAFIKSFTIQVFEDQEPIQAAIVNDTIKVLWVSYHEIPETITPVIELTDKAVVSPKAAVEIPFKTGEKYTVTSEAGTTKQYTLQVDFRQPQPKSFRLETTGSLGGWTSIQGGYGTATDHLWFNLEQTRVYLVSAADQTKEYNCEIVYLGTGTGINPFSSYGIYFYLPTNMPIGKYDVRVKNGEYVLRQSLEKDWFNFTVTAPTTIEISRWHPAKFTLKGGDTFSIRGTKLDTGKNLFISIGTNGTRRPIEIVTRTAYTATFKVPVGTPAGIYNRLFFVDENLAESRVSTELTITE